MKILEKLYSIIEIIGGILIGFTLILCIDNFDYMWNIPVILMLMFVCKFLKNKI